MLCDAREKGRETRPDARSQHSEKGSERACREWWEGETKLPCLVDMSADKTP